MIVADVQILIQTICAVIGVILGLVGVWYGRLERRRAKGRNEENKLRVLLYESALERFFELQPEATRQRAEPPRFVEVAAIAIPTEAEVREALKVWRARNSSNYLSAEPPQAEAPEESVQQMKGWFNRDPWSIAESLMRVREPNRFYGPSCWFPRSAIWGATVYGVIGWVVGLAVRSLT